MSGLNIQNSRVQMKYSTSSGETPTIAPSTDHTDGTWTPTDVYVGEVFFNVFDDAAWFRSLNGLVPLTSGASYVSTYVNITGGTMTGGLVTPSLSATSITGTTIYSPNFNGIFVGDGSGLTGITSTTFTGGTISGDVTFTNNVDMCAASLSASTISGCGGELEIDTDLNVIGDISGTTFYGDGSGLTNLPYFTGLTLDEVLTFGDTSTSGNIVLSGGSITLGTGTFFGDGSGLSNVPFGPTPTLDEVLQSGNTSTNYDILLTNGNIVLGTGIFTGDGSGLTNLPIASATTQTLAQVLVNGNTTDGNGIVVDSGDAIVLGDSLANSYRYIGGNGGGDLVIGNGTTALTSSTIISRTSGSEESKLLLYTSGLTFEQTGVTTTGIQYAGDYTTGFTNNTLVTKQYVDNALTGATGDYLPLSGGTMDDNAIIEFDNLSQLREGIYDFGGQGGISQICSVGYENNWQSGINHIFDNNGYIRESSHCFSIIPDNTFDSTLQFKIGSRWVLDNGDTYECSDITVNAAVWTLLNNNDTYWTSGSTGNYSIKANNDSGLDATGDYSYAEGAGTTAIGNHSHAEGFSTIASGQTSHAEGGTTLASGDVSHAEGENTTAYGNRSHAEGNTTTAIGDNSHAEGYLTIASGSTSHAEGNTTIASGTYSHAEGSNTIASNTNSHAEGYTTTASGDVSHSEGNETTASGDYSHSEGDHTIASGQTSHAEGTYTTASGDYSHAEGILTIAYGNQSHAEGYQTIASGYTSHAEGESTTASGNYSHAEGYGTIASGIKSHAEGQMTLASGVYSHAEGQSTIASGNDSHAEGGSTQASGTTAHAEGYNTLASGNFSHSQNLSTTASGYASHAEGHDTTASGSTSHAEGYQTTAGGGFSHAEGDSTIASGQASHAEGDHSHAEGQYTTASGYQSHAEGQSSTASGDTSHAEGYYTTASSLASHSEGNHTLASGDASHAEGYYTTASGYYSHAQGVLNIASGYGTHSSGSGSTATGDWSFVHGTGSTASAAGSIVLGSNLSGVSSNTVYVNKLNINSLPAGTSINNLGIDSSGNIIIGSAGGATFTGGTVSGATNFTNGLTATTISATTYYGDGSNLTGIAASATEFVVNCRNQSGANMYRGQAVFISGSTGNKPTIQLAQANTEATSARTFGVLKNDIANNAFGDVVTIGSITNLDTRAVATNPFTVNTLADGDRLYLSPTTAGYVTNVKPNAPNHIVYIGNVIRTSPTNGYIEYQIQNGSELNELADVNISGLTQGDILIYNSGTTLWENRANLGSFGITIDGGGSAITSGVKGYVEIPYSGTITSWTIMADQSGSTVIDLWKDTYANYPPTSGDTIAGSAKPTLTAAVKAQSSTLTGWTTAVAAGDIIAFNVVSASTVTRITLSIKINKS